MGSWFYSTEYVLQNRPVRISGIVHAEDEIAAYKRAVTSHGKQPLSPHSTGYDIMQKFFVTIGEITLAATRCTIPSGFLK